MQEAKFSVNVRFNFKGYDAQYTMRDDENGITLLDKFTQLIARLEKIGALPERRWEGVKNGNGNGHAEPETPKAAVPPTCSHCKSSDHMELVEFTRDGVTKKAWKCQKCQKWYYEPKAKK